MKWKEKIVCVMKLGVMPAVRGSGARLVAEQRCHRQRNLLLGVGGADEKRDHEEEEGRKSEGHDRCDVGESDLTVTLLSCQASDFNER